jgi:hypothetical protein
VGVIVDIELKEPIRMTDIKQFREVPLSNRFDNEEYDFTPWLKEHLHLLAGDDLLGFPLEEPQREVDVGPYEADIVAQGGTNDLTVVIENEFGSTDHKHLGQSLVYTAGEKADVAVWIAEEFTPEHTQALHMLNTRTDDEIAFFGIEAGLRQIGDSPFAIDFVPVVRPENWSPVDAEEDISKTEEAELQFWKSFRSYLSQHDLDNYASRQARPSASYTISTGFSEARIRPTARFRDGTLHCMVRIDDPEGNFAGLDEDIFRSNVEDVTANLDTEQIQPDIADQLVWTPNPDGRYDNIRLHYGDADFEEHANWSTYHQWLAESAQVYKTALTDQLQ